MTPPTHTPTGGDAGRVALAQYIDRFGEQYSAAIAAAPAPAARPWVLPRPRVRFGLPRLAAMATAVVAIAVAIVVATALPTGTHLSLTERASAALGAPNEIIHFETYPVAIPGVRSNPACDGRRTETWQTTSGPPRWHMVNPSVDPACGRLTASDGTAITGPQEESTDGTTSVDYIRDLHRFDTTTNVPGIPADAPSLADTSQIMGDGRARDFVANLQGMLAQGELRQVGAPRVERGRRVIVLAGSRTFTNSSGTFQNREHLTTTYVVDASTYVPLRLTTKATITYLDQAGKPKPDQEVFGHSTVFSIYERLPLNADTEKLLEIHPTVPVKRRTETLAQRTERVRREAAEQLPPALPEAPRRARP